MAKYSIPPFIFVASMFLFITSVSSQIANVIVSLDGTANFSTIGEAIGAAPNNSVLPFPIYVKEGTYFEKVYISREKKNIILLGDGMNKTVITGNKSNFSGFSTQDSATMNVETNFMAKNLSIVNSAGPQGGQAVALRFSGNYICCYRCSIEGYQDTLYLAEGQKQFFYESNIYGTIDFIFGGATVVLQNSFIYVGTLLPGQFNVITADGRNSLDNTAIVIHNCTITVAPRYTISVKTYLGRPWKEFSRTIIMQSYLDVIIDPEGWHEFDKIVPLNKLFYGEYKNEGPGAFTMQRVKWPGYHVLSNSEHVKNFTMEEFINGNEWLPKLQVPFVPGLIE